MSFEHVPGFRKGEFMRIALAICLAAVIGCTSEETVADVDWEKLRVEAVNRPRTLVYNTDGNDVYHWPSNLPVTAENFTGRRGLI